ncbi:hypothetical protein GOBAR_AA18620 [Gossypium barbadense]|uniref:Uncharacterized protein n=1 Tax=Gossypium barbadense TaxID=3634 RepID=A0A2P5XFD0_GOSBA|nr:hypothetical protein GOBAR_AA18620 [Gossypium barbadense]
MKPPHELDEKVVVAETVAPHSVEGHHQECPRRPPPRQPSNIGTNGDDPLPMPLRLVLNREGDEIGKVDDVPVAPPGTSASQHREEERRMWRLKALYKPSTVPNSGRLSWWTNPPRKN